MYHAQMLFLPLNAGKLALSAICRTWALRTIAEKKLPPMKLLLPFFVLTCEDNDKLDVAEMEHDNDNH